MSLPGALGAALSALLGAEPARVQRVGGGSISAVARFSAAGQDYLVKWHERPASAPAGWPGMFEAEARGLALLAAAEALRVPQVRGFSDSAPAYILLEWIERSSAAPGAALGQGLASLHRHSAPSYGLDHQNYCGATPQDNRPLARWSDFYGQRRLGFQLELAARHGLLPAARRQRLERLIARLDQWIDDTACRPALLHGDLWGGNWLAGPHGEPVLIDPAAYFGVPEAELAMCRLFGGFPPSFYAAYDEASPPAPGRDERVPLYQLYHLLNHLNLFGEGYGAQVDEVLDHYVG